MPDLLEVGTASIGTLGSPAGRSRRFAPGTGSERQARTRQFGLARAAGPSAAITSGKHRPDNRR
jgi:hypothetical protein